MTEYFLIIIVNEGNYILYYGYQWWKCCFGCIQPIKFSINLYLMNNAISVSNYR